MPSPDPPWRNCCPEPSECGDWRCTARLFKHHACQKTVGKPIRFQRCQIEWQAAVRKNYVTRGPSFVFTVVAVGMNETAGAGRKARVVAAGRSAHQSGQAQASVRCPALLRESVELLPGLPRQEIRVSKHEPVSCNHHYFTYATHTLSLKRCAFEYSAVMYCALLCCSCSLMYDAPVLYNNARYLPVSTTVAAG